MASKDTTRDVYFDNTALPYVVGRNPVINEPRIVAGQNVLTSYKKQMERRPGFSEYIEASPKQFGGTLRRIFSWRKWNGSFYVMANDINLTTSESTVYKLEVGVDTQFVPLLTSVGSTEPFDFVTANNQIYCGDGTSMIRWDGVLPVARNWGIQAPSNAPVAAAGAAGALTGTFTYRVCYGTTETGQLSSPSPESASVTLAAQKADITLVPSLDAQVDEIHVFRTTNGGGGIWYEIANSPFPNTAATISDETADTSLDTASVCPASFRNDRPPGARGMVFYAGRIWMFTDNRVWYTGFEEITNGVPEESVPSGSITGTSDGNYFTFDSEVTGLSVCEDGVLVFTAYKIFKIEGDSLDTFRRSIFHERKGVRNQLCIARSGLVTAWLDTSSQVWITDGFRSQELSVNIRSDIANVIHSNCSLVFHEAGERRWLLLADGINIWPYDLDIEQWMPPWTVSAFALCSAEVAEADYQLLIGYEKSEGVNKVLKLGAGYNDDTTTYTPTVTMSPFIIAGQTVRRVGVLNSVNLEFEGSSPSQVERLLDDDPVEGEYTDLTENQSVPPYKTQGTYLLEYEYPDMGQMGSDQKSGVGRRVSLRLAWPQEDAAFALNSIGFEVKDFS